MHNLRLWILEYFVLLCSNYVVAWTHITELTLAVFWYVPTQLSWPWLCCGMFSHNWVDPVCVVASSHTNELTMLCWGMFPHNGVDPGCVGACLHTTELTPAVLGFCSYTTELTLAVLGHFPTKLSWPWLCRGMFPHNWVDLMPFSTLARTAI